MKWFIFSAFAGCLTLYFANENLHNIGLAVVQDGEWQITASGWEVLTKVWPVWLIIGLGAGLAIILSLSFFSYSEEKMKGQYKNKVTKVKRDYETKISQIEKTHASQIESLFFEQVSDGKYLQDAYAETAKCKFLISEQEDANALLIQKIKAKDAIILRRERKIKRLSLSF